MALVTGSNKGIGFAIAQLFAEQGISVIIAARNADLGNSAVANLKKAVPDATATFCQLDITDAASISSCAEHVKQNFGKLDILVNNAGIAYKGNTFGAEEAETTIACNVKGTRAVCEAMLPLLKAAGGGRIVNLCSRCAISASLVPCVKRSPPPHTQHLLHVGPGTATAGALLQTTQIIAQRAAQGRARALGCVSPCTGQLIPSEVATYPSNAVTGTSTLPRCHATGTAAPPRVHTPPILPVDVGPPHPAPCCVHVSRATACCVLCRAGMLRQLSSPELRAAFAAPESADAVAALANSFVDAIRSGDHQRLGWSNSMYGVSKLAEMSYTRCLASQLKPEARPPPPPSQPCVPGPLCLEHLW